MRNPGNKTPLARIREHIGWIASGKGFGGLLSLVYLGILTRSLGPTQFGSFSLILSSILIIQMLPNCNVWQIVVKYGHQHIKAENFGALGRLIRLCIMVDLGSAVVSIAITGLVLIFGRRSLAMDDQLAWVTFLYAVLFLFSLRNVPRGILRLTNSFPLIFLGEGVPSLVKFAGALFALAIGPSTATFLLIWAISELVGTMVFWWHASRVYKLHFGRFDGSNWRQAWYENEGLPSLIVATNISETASGAAQQLPILFVGSFAGTAGAGLFRLANQLTAALAQISGFINLAGYTEMANIHAEGGLAQVRGVFYRLSLVSAGIAVAILAVVLLLGKSIILLMSGPAFSDAYPFLLLLGIAVAVQILGANCEPMLMSAGRSKTLITLRLAGGIALVGLLILLLPTMGAVGAAWARVATEGATLVALAILSHSLLRKARPHL